MVEEKTASIRTISQGTNGDILSCRKFSMLSSMLNSIYQQ